MFPRILSENLSKNQSELHSSVSSEFLKGFSYSYKLSFRDSSRIIFLGFSSIFPQEVSIEIHKEFLQSFLQIFKQRLLQIFSYGSPLHVASRNYIRYFLQRYPRKFYHELFQEFIKKNLQKYSCRYFFTCFSRDFSEIFIICTRNASQNPPGILLWDFCRSSSEHFSR